MRKRAISILSVLILAVCAADAGVSFAHTAAIKAGGENRYKAVRLTPQVYNASNSDLSDLSIKDGNGENVPYFINTGFEMSYSDMESYPLELINAYTKDSSFYFDYRLAEERPSDTVSTSIEFVTQNTGFAKEADVYGSYDNIHWEYVQSDKIYSIDNISKLAINFVRPQKFTHYRLRLANNLEHISFDEAKLVYSVETSEQIHFIENLKPVFTVNSSDKQTNIVIDGLKNLRLCDISIHTDSMFKRNVYTAHGISKELYNISLDGASYADTTIPMGWSISQDDTYSITIDDGDDKPISVSRITVRYYADDLVFEWKQGRSYTLEFSGDPGKTAPVYDIERYKSDILKGTIDRATIGKIQYTYAPAPSPARDYRMIFNAVVIIVALLLGAVIVMRLRKK
jgi:hypothetical protein